MISAYSALSTYECWCQEPPSIFLLTCRYLWMTELSGIRLSMWATFFPQKSSHSCQNSFSGSPWLPKSRSLLWRSLSYRSRHSRGTLWVWALFRFPTQCRWLTWRRKRTTARSSIYQTLWWYSCAKATSQASSVLPTPRRCSFAWTHCWWSPSHLRTNYSAVAAPSDSSLLA